MDNHSWLMIKSFHKFAFVVQVLYIHVPVSPSFLFLMSMRKSPFDAVSFLCKSCVWKAAETTFREEHSSDRKLTLLAFCKAL